MSPIEPRNAPGASVGRGPAARALLPDMDIAQALTFVRRQRNGVLVTQRRNGRPQLSNISHAADDEGIVRISTTADRAKARNMARTPLASLHVTSEDFWAYVVLEADVELSAIAQSPDDEVANELVSYYRSIVGEHPDWDDYRAAMVREQRLVVRLHPTHAYGTWSPSADDG